MLILLRRMTHRHWCFAFAAAAAATLGIVYTAQYGFGLEPCELCHWQRVPYFAALVVAAGALAFKRERAGLWTLGACFAAGLMIAGFHAGVEQHWWEGLTSCSAKLDTSDLEKLREQILNGPRARCDDIPWALFGISMAGFNVIWSLVLSVTAFVAAKRHTAV